MRQVGRNAEWNIADWLAAAAGLLGVVVLAGYATHTAVLVDLQSSQNVSMAISSAVSFILASLILLLRGRKAMVLALLLLALNVLVLLENAAGLNLGIDLPGTLGWLHQQTLHPGRMSLVTNAGFLLVAAAALVQPHINRRSAWVLRWLTWLLLADGLLGTLGYFLRFDLIYNLRSMERTALHSGAGLIVLGLALWWSWHDERWNHSPEEGELGTRIVSSAMLALVVVVVVAGFSGLWLVRRMVQRDATTDLTLRRQQRVNYVELLIRDAVQRSQRYAALPQLEPLLANTSRRILPATPAPEFSSISIYNPRGTLVAHYGQPILANLPSVPLPLGPKARLVWDGEFYLRQQLPIERSGQTLGRVEMEQPLLLLGTIGVGSAVFGGSGEIGLCGRKQVGQAPIQCFPQRLLPRPYTLQPWIAGVEHPMALALNGKTGVSDTLDYRGQRVLAAYAPVPGLGLGLVVKMDNAELYAPIRLQIEILVPILAALTLGGVELLRWRVRPLVRQLVASRNLALSSEARFRAAAESGMDPFYIFQSGRSPTNGEIIDFHLIYANQPGEEFANLAPAVKTAAAPLGLSAVPQLAAAGVMFDKFRTIVVHRSNLVEEFLAGAGGQGPQWLHLQAVPLGDGVAVTLRDISEQRWEKERLLVMAQTDPLTGLSNRSAFENRLRHAMEASRRLRRQALLAVLYLDIDRFKSINDTFGHLAGDRVLRWFAARLLESVRSADTVARPGGDEFAILLENLDSPSDAERVVAGIFRSLQEPLALDDHSLSIATSIGVAYFRGEEVSVQEILSRADAALYAAKRGGRNTFKIYAT